MTLLTCYDQFCRVRPMVAEHLHSPFRLSNSILVPLLRQEQRRQHLEEDPITATVMVAALPLRPPGAVPLPTVTAGHGVKDNLPQSFLTFRLHLTREGIHHLVAVLPVLPVRFEAQFWTTTRIKFSIEKALGTIFVFSLKFLAHLTIGDVCFKGEMITCSQFLLCCRAKVHKCYGLSLFVLVFL